MNSGEAVALGSNAKQVLKFWIDVGSGPASGHVPESRGRASMPLQIYAVRGFADRTLARADFALVVHLI